MLTLNDGRNELWQWDTGRNLTVDADCSQVHFSNKVFGRSIDVDVVDGIVNIPDVLLQTDKDLTAWAFVGTAENGYTKISKVFKVNKRNKPADYVFTPTDQTTLGEILDRIEDLENRPSGDISEEDIQNAVNDYLDKNPISVEEKDPTVPAWAKQSEKPKYTAEEVGALPNTIVIPVVPSALPNPHKLTFTGAVTAEYDGSEPVEVVIPEGGGGGIEVTGAEVGQTIVVKAVDENGKPTEWECAEPTLPLVCEFELSEPVAEWYINKDSKGNPFDLKRYEMFVYIPAGAGLSTGSLGIDSVGAYFHNDGSVKTCYYVWGDTSVGVANILYTKQDWNVAFRSYIAKTKKQFFVGTYDTARTLPVGTKVVVRGY